MKFKIGDKVQITRDWQRHLHEDLSTTQKRFHGDNRYIGTITEIKRSKYIIYDEREESTSEWTEKVIELHREANEL